MLEKTMHLNYLFDFYQALLTPKQRDYMKMYYLEDFSLVEIARLSDVSRQAVYDNIKRTEAILETYETKLGLYRKFSQRLELITILEANVDSKKENRILMETIVKLKELG